jgi:hypothetical protein
MRPGCALRSTRRGAGRVVAPAPPPVPGWASRRAARLPSSKRRRQDSRSPAPRPARRGRRAQTARSRETSTRALRGRFGGGTRDRAWRYRLPTRGGRRPRSARLRDPVVSRSRSRTRGRARVPREHRDHGGRSPECHEEREDDRDREHWCRTCPSPIDSLRRGREAFCEMSPPPALTAAPTTRLIGRRRHGSRGPGVPRRRPPPARDRPGSRCRREAPTLACAVIALARAAGVRRRRSRVS